MITTTCWLTFLDSWPASAGVSGCCARLTACVLAAAGLPAATTACDATRAGTDTATRRDRARACAGRATLGMRRCMGILRTGRRPASAARDYAGADVHANINNFAWEFPTE